MKARHYIVTGERGGRWRIYRTNTQDNDYVYYWSGIEADTSYEAGRIAKLFNQDELARHAAG